jgi:hypothetical protein
MARPRIGLVPIPIEHDGAHYPSRKALAQHLAAIKGRAVSTWTARLSRFDGDVVQHLNKQGHASNQADPSGRGLRLAQGAGAASGCDTRWLP